MNEPRDPFEAELSVLRPHEVLDHVRGPARAPYCLAADVIGLARNSPAKR